MRKGLVLSSLALLLPLSAFGDGVTLPEVKEAVGYLMDDVSTIQKEMRLLRKEIKALRKKVTLLEQQIREEKNRQNSTKNLPSFFRKEDYKGKLVFAGTFRSFSHALMRTQNLLELNLSPDVLLLHNGMFSVVLKSNNRERAISLCSLLKRKGIECFVGRKDKYVLRVFPVSRLFAEAEKLLKGNDSVEIDGLRFIKTDLLSAKPYLCKKVKDGYIALLTGGVL
ncbi:hypothetical protein [Desulfurobacterium crinifex]